MEVDMVAREDMVVKGDLVMVDRMEVDMVAREDMVVKGDLVMEEDMKQGKEDVEAWEGANEWEVKEGVDTLLP